MAAEGLQLRNKALQLLQRLLPEPVISKNVTQISGVLHRYLAAFADRFVHRIRSFAVKYYICSIACSGEERKGCAEKPEISS